MVIFQINYEKENLSFFLGYSLSCLSKFIIALSNVWGLVFVGRVADRLGKGVRTAARDAMLFEYSDTSNQSHVFGIHRGMDSIRAIIGPLFALGLLSIWQTDLKNILLIAAFPGMFGLLLFFVVKEVLPQRTSVKNLSFWTSIKDFPTNFKIFLAGLALFNLGNSSDTFLTLKAQGIGLSMETIILAYIVYNIVISLFSASSGKFADKFGRRNVFLCGIFLYGIVYLGFALNNNIYGVFLLFFLYGLYVVMTDGISKAIVGTLIPPEKLGTAYGLMQTVIGISMLLASMAGGFLWSFLGSSATFYFGALCSSTSFIFLFICFRSTSKKCLLIDNLKRS